jgi:hypothetical protein
MIASIKKYFEPTEVTNRVFNRFIDTGEVPEGVIKTLAMKIIFQRPMTDNEKCVFFAKTSEVNAMIVKLKNQE